MLKGSLEYYKSFEDEWPGFVDTIVKYENAILPACPYCGSYHTAQVTPGFVKASFTLFRATTKFMIDPQGRGKLFCNDCRKFFTPEDYEGPIWWHELIDISNEKDE